MGGESSDRDRELGERLRGGGRGWRHRGRGERIGIARGDGGRPASENNLFFF